MEVSRREFVKMVGAGAAAAPLPKAMEESIHWRLQVPDSTDPLAAKTVQIVPNMEPVIPHEDQTAAAQKKLAALEKKTGKKPNILIFLMDNVGWGDLASTAAG